MKESFKRNLVLLAATVLAMAVLAGCQGADTAVQAQSSAQDQAASETSGQAAAPGQGQEGPSASSEDAAEDAAPVEPSYWFEYCTIEGADSYQYLKISTDDEAAAKVLIPLNERWHSEAEQALAHTYKEGDAPTAESNTSYGNTVTYFDKNVVGVTTSSYMYSGGAHGYIKPSSAVYKLDTGEETTAYDYLGVSRDQVEEYGRAALDAFLGKHAEGNTGLKANADDVFAYSSFWDMVESGMLTLDLTPDGMAMFCNHDVIGIHAAGVAEFLLCDSNGNPAAFDGEMYSLPEITSPAPAEGASDSAESPMPTAPAESPMPAAPAADQQAGPLAAYAPVVAEYQAAMASSSYPGEATYVNPEAWAAHYDANGIATDRDLSCALVDLAGDGEPELVFAYKFDSGGNGTGTSGSVATYRPYDLYGIENGEAKRMADDLGFKAVLYFYEDGTVCSTYTDADGGAVTYTSEYYTVPEHAATLQLVEAVVSGSGDPVYRDSNGNSQTVSMDEVQGVWEKYRERGVMEDIEWVSVADAAQIGIDASEAPAAPAAETAGEPTRIQGDGYSFGIPAYWEGKVDVREDNGSYVIYAKKLPEAAIVRFTVEDASLPKNGGDVASGVLGWYDLGNGQRLRVSQSNWTFLLSSLNTVQHDYYGADADYLIDLVTGGNYTSATIEGNNMAQPDWLRDNLLPLIQIG